MPRVTKGHNEQLPSGSFRVHVYAGTDPLTRRPIRLKATVGTEQQAHIELGRLLKEASEGRTPESDATVAKLQRAVTTGDGITHRIIVRAPTAYPIKWVDAEIGYRTNSGLGIIPPGWMFERPVTENGEVRYACFAKVNPQVSDPAPIVRFADRNGNLYYSYLGYTCRFGQNTDWITAATEIDKWIRTGPRPDEPDDGQ